jgi:hypothetical protein
MFSLLAIAGVFLGLLLLPAWPALGGALVCGGVVSANAAMKRPDDLPFAIGIGLMIALALGVLQVAVFMADSLAAS